MRSPIKRDGLMVALYTGLRHEDVRTLRFDLVDFDDQTLHLPNPKGGESKAFTIPLSKTPFAILQRRQRDNAKDLGRGDDGWCFPGIDQEGKVGPVSELRAAVTTRKNGKRIAEGRFPVEDVHSLRRTWESIANDEGITELDQHVLSNHSFGSHNVNATYISQHIDHLATCAEKVDAGHHAPHSGHASSEAEGKAASRGAVAWRRSSKKRSGRRSPTRPRCSCGAWRRCNGMRSTSRARGPQPRRGAADHAAPGRRGTDRGEQGCAAIAAEAVSTSRLTVIARADSADRSPRRALLRPWPKPT